MPDLPEHVALPILASLFTFAAGLLLGHWLAIGRERRTAFNEVAQRIRVELLKVRDRPGIAHVHSTDRDLYCRLAPAWKSRRFEKAWRRFEQARNAVRRRDSAGGVYYDQSAELQQSFEELLRLTAWR